MGALDNVSHFGLPDTWSARPSEWTTPQGEPPLSTFDLLGQILRFYKHVGNVVGWRPKLYSMARIPNGRAIQTSYADVCMNKASAIFRAMYRDSRAVIFPRRSARVAISWKWMTLCLLFGNNSYFIPSSGNRDGSWIAKMNICGSISYLATHRNSATYR